MRLLKDQLTPHFRLSEFQCSDGGVVLLTPGFVTFVVDVLEPFRVWYNRPININSGYRTAAHNRKVGGSSNSLHLIGQAVDFNLPAEFKGMRPERQEKFINNIWGKWSGLCYAAGGFPHMGVYSGYLHLGLSWEKSYYKDNRRGAA